MEYNFSEIEAKQQQKWEESQIYKTDIDPSKPKFYVLDMFPYPSGAGLHVGHPLGYIASDIYSRFKRQKGFNVLHPMGFDAFGLPAEQYAVRTGQHPAKTTEINIKRYKEQLKKMGLSFDWSREILTANPDYYKWTQWAFLKMFDHWFDKNQQKARPVKELIEELEQNGNINLSAACNPNTPTIEAAVWNGFEEAEKQDFLMNYRLAYRAKTKVNWCAELGTVLANDEVKDGLSERGGHPVVQKEMMQWQLRITAYAQRLLKGLEELEWTDSLKEMQRNWIGESTGAELLFEIENSKEKIPVFTTRPDTIFGVSFIVLAPESDQVDKITTPEQSETVEKYIRKTQNRTERERMAEAENVTGVFSGAYAIHPFTKKKIPVWIADYVLAGYGTGAIMAVPAHDSRDYAFARHFRLPILPVVQGGQIEEQAYEAKTGKLINSDFLNGYEVKDAHSKMLDEIEQRKIGRKKTNYRLRDAIFSRQRYWGEPFPVYYDENATARPLPEDQLPLTLPDINDYKPTETGEPPLGRAKSWKYNNRYPYELSTMPGFAGSSAYFLRYMDPQNSEALVGKEANTYWQDVDLYVGGTEHAVGHLMYARFWNKFLFDTGYVIKDEPFKKMINQGMIQGKSYFVYRIKNSQKYVSYNLRNDYDTSAMHVDVNIVKNDVLDTEAFRQWRPENKEAEFITEDGKYICGHAIEKMSKSKYNVVNPDQIIEQYGADTLRLYEMFLGPVEQSKPWNTHGIEGVYRFLNKFWRMFFDTNGECKLCEEEPSPAEQKIIHTLIKKVNEDIERFSFNTAVSAFMVAANDLSKIKSKNRTVLEQFLIVLSPFAPHICEELWSIIGKEGSVITARFPEAEEKYLKEDTVTYPIAFNGKTRFTIDFPAQMPKEEIEKQLLADQKVIEKLDGKPIRKFILVPGRMINIVC